MPSKRERYERANTRGGLGVRKRLSEDSFRPTYRLNGVQTGSVVVRAHDKYRGDFTLGFDVGTLIRKTASAATIHWLGEDEPVVYSAGDARYEVDRGRWRFLGIMQGNPLDPANPLADALTALTGKYRVGISGNSKSDTPPTEETEDMSKLSNAAAEREAAQKALANGDLKKRDTYTAKQVATRCGTDSKTMRKFFRSNHSTVEPVGQGGRYEFDAKDFPKIKKEFDAWQTKAKSRQTKPTVPITEVMEQAKQTYIDGKTKPLDQVHTEEEIAEGKRVEPEEVTLKRWLKSSGDEDQILRENAEEPTDEELAELEGMDLDLDDLDES